MRETSIDSSFWHPVLTNCFCLVLGCPFLMTSVYRWLTEIRVRRASFLRGLILNHRRPGYKRYFSVVVKIANILGAFAHEYKAQVGVRLLVITNLSGLLLSVMLMERGRLGVKGSYCPRRVLAQAAKTRGGTLEVPAHREENCAVQEISIFENTARKGLLKLHWGWNKHALTNRIEVIEVHSI